ncbi:MFS transporter [Sphingosinicella rhizophila]|uniref:MFS transporter n=1 Tax=Sphingosinicella rhizophila TaxID=3050082 RepID=A0ABU3Q8C6_9SPHN|nr:MFS transporter [Sphingosinicella sp. GR2756]MDT9599662.1 MFS transporter [Sphingosinicella sp. GR2756]
MATVSSLSRERFALLFGVMLVAAAGNTALQSLMPSIGRQLGVPDLWVAAAFSLSAVIWVLTAPHWARRADHRGRRALMRLGLYGFIASMLVCGGALAAGLAGLIGPMAVFLIFIVGRAAYGAWGSASPPAVQAYIAARTEGAERTSALATIASSFGLGTIAGPAIAPLFIFPPLGLSGPLIIFAVIGIAVLLAVVTRLPDDTPRSSARGQIIGYPSLGDMNSGAGSDDQDWSPATLAWRDPRVFGWHMIGAIGGHGQAALFGVIGFLVIDRLRVSPSEAQQWIAIVLMSGAAATLLAQWGLIPRLGLDPRRLVLWGCLLSALGAIIIGIAAGMYGITLGFALASLGFGFFRPGYTSGASLAVTRSEQNRVAGMVTSVNGIAFIGAPAAAVALYSLSKALPFFVTAALLVALTFWVWLRFIPSDQAA